MDRNRFKSRNTPIYTPRTPGVVNRQSGSAQDPDNTDLKEEMLPHAGVDDQAQPEIIKEMPNIQTESKHPFTESTQVNDQSQPENQRSFKPPTAVNEKKGKFKLSKKSVIALVTATTIIAIVAVSAVLLSHGKKNNNQNQVSLQGASIPVVNATKPSFTPVAPTNEPGLGKGGKDTAYDSLHGAYAYTDTYLGSSLAVTEEYVPLGYSNSQQAAVALAKSLNVTTTTNSNYGTIYIKTDPQTLAQTTFGAIKNLFIVIESTKPLGNSDWTAYFNNLN